ncbi:MAG: hypothetical protein M1400_02685 [Patescibacteria group bacterium]|nr:hypothetical protein [Patescibacteria group bacterium]
MELSEVLTKIGLNEKEAKVYLALLELGPATAYRIAPKAGIKRSIAYVVLESLQARGLVSVVPQGERKLFVAGDPGKLLGELEQRKELYKRFLPNLEALYADSSRKEKPQVQFFEGREAVYSLYEKIYESKDVAFFSTIRDILSLFPDFPKKLNEKALEGRVKVRELLTFGPSDLAYAKTMRHNVFFQQRFAEGIGEFFTDNCLFDGQVAFFAFDPFLYAVLVRSDGVYKSLKTLYEFAWTSAVPYDEAIKKPLS